MSRNEFQSYAWIKDGKDLAWTEEAMGGGAERRARKGGTAKRMSEIYYLVSVRCCGNSAIPKKENGKGKEDEVHHVPAPNLAFYLERKPIPCLGTPLDATATPAPFHATQGDEEVKVGSRERKSSMQMEQQQQRSKMDVSGKKEQRQETELDESWLKITMAGKVTPNTGLGCKGVALCCCLKC